MWDQLSVEPTAAVHCQSGHVPPGHLHLGRDVNPSDPWLALPGISATGHLDAPGALGPSQGCESMCFFPALQGRLTWTQASGSCPTQAAYLVLQNSYIFICMNKYMPYVGTRLFYGK